MALCILLMLLWQVDKGISSEIVRSILAERANWPCLAAQSAVKVSDSYFYLPSVFLISLNVILKFSSVVSF